MQTLHGSHLLKILNFLLELVIRRPQGVMCCKAETSPCLSSLSSLSHLSIFPLLSLSLSLYVSLSPSLSLSLRISLSLSLLQPQAWGILHHTTPKFWIWTCSDVHQNDSNFNPRSWKLQEENHPNMEAHHSEVQWDRSWWIATGEPVLPVWVPGPFSQLWWHLFTAHPQIQGL